MKRTVLYSVFILLIALMAAILMQYINSNERCGAVSSLTEEIARIPFGPIIHPYFEGVEITIAGRNFDRTLIYYDISNMSDHVIYHINSHPTEYFDGQVWQEKTLLRPQIVTSEESNWRRLYPQTVSSLYRQLYTIRFGQLYRITEVVGVRAGDEFFRHYLRVEFFWIE